MPVLESKLDTRSDAYQGNRADMLEMLGVADALLEEAAQGGGEEAIKRLRRAMELSPELQGARMLLAHVYAQAGLDDEALEALLGLDSPRTRRCSSTI